VAAIFRTRYSGFILIALLLVLWEVVARSGAVSTVAFPPFSRVIVALWNLLVTGKIVTILLPSLERLAWGYLIAVLIGGTFGVAMGYFPAAYRLFEPLTELLRPIPSPAYVPIAILFLGLGDEMKIFLIAFSSVFPILLSTSSGVRAVDIIQINTARSFGLGPGMILWKVVVPAAGPQILTGMRVSLAIALIMVVISEMVASVDGIGFFILNAQRAFRVPDMYAGVITLGLVGYGLSAIFLRFERYLLTWHFDAHQREQS
jgi:ABC-type nitrate/sulfonate/bicarbonate transport system permease component